MKKRYSKEGFTIVEIALVLAMAGLIFLMVFVALPAVQRTQRDAERRDDVGTLLTAIQKYQNNNRGALPTTNGTSEIETSWNNSWNDSNKPNEGTWGRLYYSFLGKEFTDPRGNNYTIVAKMCSANAGSTCSGNINSVEGKTFEENAYKMYIAVGAICDGSKAVGSSNPRKVAIVYKMEGAGAYCASAQ
ncbi:type II secretion system protein [Candidatus Saccharibacteria bacterium]|nr:type II secretion system protein [Candidatus Saccharibacteria bacterium]